MLNGVSGCLLGFQAALTDLYVECCFRLPLLAGGCRRAADVPFSLRWTGFQATFWASFRQMAFSGCLWRV